MLEAWEARLAGADEEGEGRMRAARDLAAQRGFRFMTAHEAARLPLTDLIERVEAVPAPRGAPDKIEAAAILGGARHPQMTVSRALDRYWSVARVKTLNKSPDQVRRWENPRRKAVANFMAVVGDLNIEDVSTKDLHLFKSWWVDKMENEGVSANSASKDFIHLTAMMREVALAEEILLRFDTKGLNIKDSDKGTRPPFSTHWLREKILADGALNGLNGEARAILLGMVNTGYRPSEGAMLTRNQIILEANIPHIKIEPVNGRALKTVHSKRVIPLCGVSLEAFRAYPDGFPRYADSPSVSDTINKYLRENGLLESPKHSLYSLRHSMEDRMLAAGFDERIRRDILGHALQRERYGSGGQLAQVHALISSIAL